MSVELDWIYRIKRYVPAAMWRAATAPYWWWYNRARHRVAAFFSPRFTEDQRKLAALRELHKGERCVIIGNGPSLKRTDLSRLKYEFTFGLNRIYLLFPELGFSTSYFAAINTLVIEQCAHEIAALEMPKFITWRARRWMKDDLSTIFLDTDYTPPPTFSRRLTGRVFEGSTVTYVALQIAYHMGFEQVVLVGVDHSFAAEGKPNVTVVSQGEDRDHFAPDYFGKGFRWQLPDLEASEAAYRMAKEAFEADGRTILDATIGGELTVFEKGDFDELFPPG